MIDLGSMFVAWSLPCLDSGQIRPGTSSVRFVLRCQTCASVVKVGSRNGLSRPAVLLIQVNAVCRISAMLACMEKTLMRKNGMPWPLRLSQRIAAAWSRWRERRSGAAELACCDPVEIDRIANDLGLSSSELRELAGRDHNAADLLTRRLAQIRLDPGTVDPVIMRDLQRCCSNCDSKGLCEHEIEDQPKAASWPKYCPNEQTLAALIAAK